MNFWVKRSVSENFQHENFSGLLPTESLRTQDSENGVGLGDLASVSKLQQLKVRSEAKNGSVTKNQRCNEKLTLLYFWSVHFETNRSWSPSTHLKVSERVRDR